MKPSGTNYLYDCEDFAGKCDLLGLVVRENAMVEDLELTVLAEYRWRVNPLRWSYLAYDEDTWTWYMYDMKLASCDQYVTPGRVRVSGEVGKAFTPATVTSPVSIFTRHPVKRVHPLFDAQVVILTTTTPETLRQLSGAPME